MSAPSRVVQRIEQHATDGPGGCRLSRYSLGSHGYPQIGWVEDGKRTMSLCHLVLWKAHHGPISPGMTVDHTCKTKRCVNVQHYRLLPNLENARRTSGRDWPLGQCVNGHLDATYWHKPASGGKGYCRACRADAQRRYWARKAARSTA